MAGEVLSFLDAKMLSPDIRCVLQGQFAVNQRGINTLYRHSYFANILDTHCRLSLCSVTSIVTNLENMKDNFNQNLDLNVSRLDKV